MLAVISGFNTLEGPVNVTNGAETMQEAIAIEVKVPQTTREHVESYFNDIPIMVEIARCESQFRQTNKGGTILRGEINSSDLGVMQINEYYHGKTAKKLGYDLYTLDGNMAYARYLYEKEGVRPWKSSSRCWAKYTEVAAS